MNKEAILARMNELGAGGPKRSLGQNFLISDIVIQKIIRAVERYATDEIIEIGPGLGSLTDELIELKRSLKLVELDQLYAQYWRDRGQNVIEGDALKIDWSQLTSGKSLLVSNLPYQISSSLVVDRSIDPKNFVTMILMFQKEVAQRLTAQPATKEYGLLTVIAQNFWRIDFLCDCSPRDYFPPPNVASRVLVFKLREEALPLEQRQKFLNFVKAGFAHRRKLLFKNLLSTHVTESTLRDAFAKLQLLPQARAEELSPEQFRELFSHSF